MRHVIEWEAVGMPRHRIARNGGRYIPDDHPVHQFQYAIRCRFRPKDLIEGPLSVEIMSYLHRPKKYDRQLPDGECPHLWTPDVDNIAKAVMDAMIDYVYADDKQVRRLVSEKLCVARGDEPRTIITVEPLGG